MMDSKVSGPLWPAIIRQSHDLRLARRAAA